MSRTTQNRTKRRTQARRRNLAARSYSANSDLRKTNAFLEWHALSEADRATLALGGIQNQDDYIDVRSDSHGNSSEFVTTIQRFGLGFSNDNAEFVALIEEREWRQMVADISSEFDGHLKRRSADKLAAGGTQPLRSRSALLPSRRHYVFAPYDLTTAEGRLWIDEAADTFGVTPHVTTSYVG